MTPVSFPTLAASAILAIAAMPSVAQSIMQPEYDLSLYRVESVHEDWRVMCTAEGTGHRSYARDCLLEDPFGLIVFVNDFGYFEYTMRGHRPGDGAIGQDFGQTANGVIITYFGPNMGPDLLDNLAPYRSGVAYPFNHNGYEQALAAAIALMVPQGR